MATTAITRHPETDSAAIPELETARGVHDEVMRAIGRAMKPGQSRSTSAVLREFTLWVMEQAREDGVVLSDDDYIELIDAITRVDVAYRVGSVVSELLHIPEDDFQWSSGMAALRQYTFMKER